MIETIKERLFEKAVLFGLFLLVCAARCRAQEWGRMASVDMAYMVDTMPPTSVITAVHDGDSYYFRGLVPSNKFARLNGVDCPEISSPYVSKTQPYGREIGDSVRVLLKGRQITYTVYGLDKLKRPLVGVFVNETDVAEILLTKGWAWYYSPNNLPSATKRLYKSLERAAKKKKLGLWADPAAIKPTAWRKQHPGLK